MRTNSPFNVLLIIAILVGPLVTVNHLQAQDASSPISPEAQSVVDYLAGKGFDVTFVYFGSDSVLTSGTEDCAVVVMRTFEHVKNMNFTATHEAQFREGNKSLSLAYPNAEVFKIVLFEDLDVNGVPDGVSGNSYTDMSGGNFGGRSGGAGILDAYWINAAKYVETGTPLPIPSPQPTPQPTTTPSPTEVTVEAQSVVNYLEAKGFDVTFVYFGSNPSLTSGTEDCAVVVMRTFEHVKNMNFTATHETQFREGNKSLSLAYPNAEIFKVVLFEDLDLDGIPDGDGGNNYTDMSGGYFGGRSGGSGIIDTYWIYASKFEKNAAPIPTPTPTPQPTAHTTSTPAPTIQPTATPIPSQTIAPTATTSCSPTPVPIDSHFQMQSNSTISFFSYNNTGTNREIHFVVSGETNTSGYVKIAIPKSFMSNPNPNIDVYLDGNKIDCQITSNADSWIVTFTYKHSTHQVSIMSQTVENFSPDSNSNWMEQATILVVVIAVAAVCGFVALKQTKSSKHQRPDSPLA